MPLTDFAPLLGELAAAFGEPAQWRGGTFVLRFRIDPFTVPLGVIDAGLNVTETWAYTEIAQVPRDADALLPSLGDTLLIRDWAWEIVEVGDDDIGERQFRLLRRERRPDTAPELDSEQSASGDALSEPPPPPWEEPRPPWPETRGPGRPSRRDEILAAYALVKARAPAGLALVRLFPEIRREITGKTQVSPGLGDKTLYKILAHL